MSYATPNLLHLIVLFLALSLTASHQVAARHLLQLNFREPSPQIGTPNLEAPALYKPPGALTFPTFQEPLLPPHLLPFLPLPSMPTIPSLPLPTGPSIPSFPTGPSIPGFPSNVPPAFPTQETKMTSEIPSSTLNMKNP